MSKITIDYVNEEDIPVWLELAKEMEPIFEGRMVDNPDFHRYMNSKITKNQALKAVDEENHLMGIIGFATSTNKINWLGVFQHYRNQGAGSLLLQTALNHLDHSIDIEVITFRENYEKGEAARHVYHKYGFIDQEDILEEHFDQLLPRRILRIKGVEE